MFIYHLDNKVFKKTLRMLNTILSVQCIHPCVRIRSCKLAASVGAINVLQRALQFAPKVFHSLALTALSSILSVAPVASRFHDLGGSFLVMYTFHPPSHPFVQTHSRHEHGRRNSAIDGRLPQSR
jgi:hypothetical protein